MRCKNVRQTVCDSDGSALAEPLRRHLANCPDCRSYAEDCGRLNAGLHALAGEAPPEPSWGFSGRVLRRLASETAGGFEFLESAGRRVILATLVLVLTLLLAMILPSSGPVRSQPSAVAYWPQTETASAVNYPVDWSSVPAVPALVDVRPAAYDEGR